MLAKYPPTATAAQGRKRGDQRVRSRTGEDEDTFFFSSGDFNFNRRRREKDDEDDNNDNVDCFWASKWYRKTTTGNDRTSELELEKQLKKKSKKRTRRRDGNERCAKRHSTTSFKNLTSFEGVWNSYATLYLTHNTNAEDEKDVKCLGMRGEYPDENTNARRLSTNRKVREIKRKKRERERDENNRRATS